MVIGSGGREHALAWKLSQSHNVKKIYVAPGNAGTALEEKCRNVDLKKEKDETNEHYFQRVAGFMREKDIELTVVGPEQPLVDGIADYLFHDLFDEGRYVFGPIKSAAELEGSKIFAKRFMHKNGIPTAGFKVFEDYKSASKHVLSRRRYPFVIKADGLAAGKGVFVCCNKIEAITALDKCMTIKEFKSAGEKIIVEDFLNGEEASILSLSDGDYFRNLVPSQDHKRLLDGDKGPNTGGMGAYAPAPVVTDKLLSTIEDRIVAPTIDSLAKVQIGYRGCLYTAVMQTKSGPKVLEFNCRFGDPETQPVMMMSDFDLHEALLACTNHYELGYGINDVKIKTRKGAALCIVLASKGYPDNPEKGKEIFGLAEAEKIDGVKVFHAGTKLVDGKFFTSGGRVLGVTAYDETIEKAKKKAYSAVDRIYFDGMQCRTDIGDKAFKHLRGD
jgi:phosphoribosylamine--glycine ligase